MFEYNKLLDWETRSNDCQYRQWLVSYLIFLKITTFAFWESRASTSFCNWGFASSEWNVSTGCSENCFVGVYVLSWQQRESVIRDKATLTSMSGLKFHWRAHTNEVNQILCVCFSFNCCNDLITHNPQTHTAPKWRLKPGNAVTPLTQSEYIQGTVLAG